MPRRWWRPEKKKRAADDDYENATDNKPRLPEIRALPRGCTLDRRFADASIEHERITVSTTPVRERVALLDGDLAREIERRGHALVRVLAVVHVDTCRRRLSLLESPRFEDAPLR